MVVNISYIRNAINSGDMLCGWDEADFIDIVVWLFKYDICHLVATVTDYEFHEFIANR